MLHIALRCQTPRMPGYLFIYPYCLSHWSRARSLFAYEALTTDDSYCLSDIPTCLGRAACLAGWPGVWVWVVVGYLNPPMAAA